MRHVCDQQRVEINFAKRKWAGLARETLTQLRELVGRYHLSVASGDVLYISNSWYITHAGLLRLAHRNHCLGIKTSLEKRCSDPLSGRWIFKAIVYKSAISKGFVGYGDADPSNVSPLVRGAEMRVAETRAVNRALRKAYGIGLCSVEELGWEPKTYTSQPSKAAPTANSNGHQNGHASLRDRLCLLIRQHQLDANLVKAYAADSCGTPNLRDATREQIEAFITNLADWATKDRPALLCKLNSYAAPHEASS
jgi:hypothetical protein